MKLKDIEERINWSWIGLGAAVLTLLITTYNIRKYYEELKIKNV